MNIRRGTVLLQQQLQAGWVEVLGFVRLSAARTPQRKKAVMDSECEEGLEPLLQSRGVLWPRLLRQLTRPRALHPRRAHLQATDVQN